MSRRAYRLNRGRISAVSGPSGPVPQPTPLLSFDARDYDTYIDGDAITGSLTPAIGSAVTASGSPVMKTGIIGGGNGIRNSGATQGFDAHWLASVMNGLNKPCTIIMRVARGTAAGYTWCGFGNSASATQNFFEVLSSAGGVSQARKKEPATVVSNAIGTTNLAFTPHVVAWVTDGTNAQLYIDKVLDTVSGNLSQPTVSINQFRFGQQGRSTGGAGLVGDYQVIQVYDVALTADQVGVATDAITARDVPATPGTPIYFVGDSLTKADGMRLATFNYIQTNTLSIDMQGAFSNGAFADNQHSGVNGVEISSIRARAVSELGTGKAFPAVELVHVLGCVNDLNNIGVNVATVLSDYATALEDIFTAASSSVATVRIAVTTIMPLEPGSQGEAEVVSWNAGVGAVWDAFDLAHPSNTLIRWDLYNAIGGAWASGNYLDSTHPNATGWATACAHPTLGLINAIGAYLTSISAP